MNHQYFNCKLLHLPWPQDFIITIMADADQATTRVSICLSRPRIFATGSTSTSTPAAQALQGIFVLFANLSLQCATMCSWDSKILLYPKLGNNLTLNLVYDTGEYLRKNHKFWVWESQKLDFLYLSFDWTRSKIYWPMYTLCNCSNNQEVADKDDSVHVWEWDGSTTRLSSVSYRTIWYHDQYISIY